MVGRRAGRWLAVTAAKKRASREVELSSAVTMQPGLVRSGLGENAGAVLMPPGVRLEGCGTIVEEVLQVKYGGAGVSRIPREG